MVVVLDNRGGRIFEQLPVGNAVAPEKLVAWTTPHSLDLWAAGQLFGIETVRPETTSDMAQAITQRLRRPGPTLIHVVTESDSARRDIESLRDFLGTGLYA